MRFAWVGDELINLSAVVSIELNRVEEGRVPRVSGLRFIMPSNPERLVASLANGRRVTIEGEGIAAFLLLIGGPVFPALHGSPRRTSGDDPNAANRTNEAES